MKLVEIPDATLYGERPEEIENVLCNLEFIAAKCSVGMGRDLILDFLLMRDKFDNHRIKSYVRFITGDMHILEKEPEAILQRVSSFSIYSRLNDINEESL